MEEILDAQRAGCPPEYINLHIPKGHPQYDPAGVGGKELPLLRTRYDMTTGYSPNNPRQQVKVQCHVVHSAHVTQTTREQHSLVYAAVSTSIILHVVLIFFQRQLFRPIYKRARFPADVTAEPNNENVFFQYFFEQLIHARLYSLQCSV